MPGGQTPNNTSVLDNLLSPVTSAAQNLVGSGSFGSPGTQGITDGIANLLNSTGINNIASGIVLGTRLDNLISGSSSFFGSGSPLRTTLNALGLRNKTASQLTDPDAIIKAEQDASTGTTLTYPPDPAPYGMVFKFFKYVRPNPLGDTKVESTGRQITLPLPDGRGLEDNTLVNFSPKDTGLFGNAIDNLKTVDSLIKDVYPDRSAIPNLSALGQPDPSRPASALTDAAVYAAAALGRNSMFSELVQAAESQFGLAPNPSLSQIFTGVPFRSFQFAWTFSPKSPGESQIVDEVIREFKKNHLPAFAGDTTSLIFNYPNICQPSFIGVGNYMTDFQYCILRSVNVSYSPQGDMPAFYAKTKAPVFISLILSFEEMEIRTTKSYGGTNAQSISERTGLDEKIKSVLRTIPRETPP